MLSILTITLPIYAIIAIGYGTVRWGLFQPKDMDVLSRYILNIALPVPLFGAVAQRDVSEVLNLSYIAVFAAAGLAMMTLSYLSFRLTDPDQMRGAVGFMGAGCPNSTFIGFPIVLAVIAGQYGKAGLAALVILFGTMGSFVTLTSLLVWLGVT